MSDFTKFCAGANDPRSYLRKPMRLDRGVAYSNGHILVLVHFDNGEYDEAPESLATTVARLRDSSNGSDEWIKVSDLGLPSGKECRICNGAKQLFVKQCTDCDGEGEFSYGCHWYDCKECDASGFVESEAKEGGHRCHRCLGTGEEPRGVAVRNGQYQVAYLKLLAELPDCELNPAGGSAAAQFRFNGGMGWLMPFSGGSRD